MSDPAHAIVPIRTYVAVFTALIVLTVVTVAIATVDLGDWNVVMALVVAVIKAALVLLFFMHLRHSSPLLWIVLSSSFFFVALLVGLVGADVFTRGHWAPMGPNLQGFELTQP